VAGANTVKLTAGLLALGLIVAPAIALARGHGGGHSHSYSHHSYSRHSYGGHSYRGHATTFRTSYCKSTACFRKHPDGKYVHPITPRHHR
jgi:hypothetical protein